MNRILLFVVQFCFVFFVCNVGMYAFIVAYGCCYIGVIVYETFDGTYGWTSALDFDYSCYCDYWKRGN